MSESTEYSRVDPRELQAFDEQSKICNMNCGPSTGDPRSAKERKYLCPDCWVVASRPKWSTRDPLVGLIQDAIQIATEAARAYIEGESVKFPRASEHRGEVWLDTRPAERYSDAWRLHWGFLKARGLIEHDKAEPWLVRIKAGQ
jgi:hypothetical protein